MEKGVIVLNFIIKDPFNEPLDTLVSLDTIKIQNTLDLSVRNLSLEFRRIVITIRSKEVTFCFCFYIDLIFHVPHIHTTTPLFSQFLW